MPPKHEGNIQAALVGASGAAAATVGIFTGAVVGTAVAGPVGAMVGTYGGAVVGLKGGIAAADAACGEYNKK